MSSNKKQKQSLLKSAASKQFQKTNIDLMMAINLAQDTSKALKLFRENADNELQKNRI